MPGVLHKAFCAARALDAMLEARRLLLKGATALRQQHRIENRPCSYVFGPLAHPRPHGPGPAIGFVPRFCGIYPRS